MINLASLIGREVQVYKNLRRGDWSVRAAGKVIAHVPEIALSDVRFVVRESRRQAVIRDRTREVHAWAIGTVTESPVWETCVAITYNPYRCGTFTRRDNGAAITQAKFVCFTAGDGAIAAL